MSGPEAIYVEIMRVQEVYNQEFSEPETNEWIEAFETTDAEVLHASVSRMIQTEDFPTIARLRRCVDEMTQEIRELESAVDDEFCGQCDRGWIFGPNNTVTACECSSLRQGQIQRGTVEHKKEWRRIGLDTEQTLPYRPVTDERAEQWRAFVAAKMRGEVDLDDDDVDGWLARQQSGRPDAPALRSPASTQRSERSGSIWEARAPDDPF